MKKSLILVLWIFGVSVGAWALGVSNGSPIAVRVQAEAGFLGVVENEIQFSKSGTYFSYPRDAGQSVLYPVNRYSVDIIMGAHTLTFLYQPLKIESTELLRKDLSIDGALFSSNTRVKFLYDFPFYRMSYLYDLTGKKDAFDLAFGVSLQIRNTTISFESLDGLLYRVNQNVGLVPILKCYAAWRPVDWFELATEIDGFYAPIKYLNGDDNNDVVGAILDASLRGKLYLDRDLGVFLNVRYLGGGAEGTSDNSVGPGDGFVKNWLHFITVTLGTSLEI